MQENGKEMMETGIQKASCCWHMCTDLQEWDIFCKTTSGNFRHKLKTRFLEWLRWGSLQDSHIRSFFITHHRLYLRI